MYETKVKCERFYSHRCFNGSYVDYLHGYQHHYERGWPGDKCILPVRCCDPEWHRYDAPAG